MFLKALAEPVPAPPLAPGGGGAYSPHAGRAANYPLVEDDAPRSSSLDESDSEALRASCQCRRGTDVLRPCRLLRKRRWGANNAAKSFPRTCGSERPAGRKVLPPG